jgi:hypothetical protein
MWDRRARLDAVEKLIYFATTGNRILGLPACSLVAIWTEL